jgi:hypothetical protein
MGKKYNNENFLHSCDEPKVVLKDHEHSVLDMKYSLEDQIRIVDFYLFHAPVLNPSKSENGFGLKSMKNYGWMGNQSMSKLEGLLLKDANLSIFCFLKSDSIADTLESMDLKDKICISHPRAVLKQNAKVSVREDGSVLVSQKETRMECLFRHVRNSLAHNHTYYFDNGNILLEDCDDSGSISARLLIPKQALLSWIDTIENKAPEQNR